MEPIFWPVRQSARKRVPAKIRSSLVASQGKLIVREGTQRHFVRLDQHHQTRDWERREEKDAKRASERGEEERQKRALR